MPPARKAAALPFALLVALALLAAAPTALGYMPRCEGSFTAHAATMVGKAGKTERISLSNGKIRGTATMPYTGRAIKPVPIVKVGLKTLRYNAVRTSLSDYTVSYRRYDVSSGSWRACSRPIRIGRYAAVVKGCGRYTGTRAVPYSITKRKLHVSSGLIGIWPYTGGRINPKVTYKLKLAGRTVKLVEGRDYTRTYRNNVNAGTAKVRTTFKGNFTGSVTDTFKIARRDIGSGKRGIIKDQLYTGRAIRPNVNMYLKTRKLSAGRDYKVSYSSNTSPGTAKVVVTGKGNFTGKKTLTFRIVTAEQKKLVEKARQELSSWGKSVHSGAKYWSALRGEPFSNGTATPWCSCFVTWCWREAGLSGKYGDPGTAAAASWGDWARYSANAEIITITPEYEAQPGDIILVGYIGGYADHVGIVEEVKADGSFTTIEGNANNAVERRGPWPPGTHFSHAVRTVV